MISTDVKKFVVGVLQGYFTNKSALDKVTTNSSNHFLFNGNDISDEISDLQSRVTDIYVETAASTQAKVGIAPGFILRNGSRYMIRILNSNSYNGKMTLNINNTGAKDVYINGTVSSSSNKTLPAGDYSVYYNSNKYYFNTADEIETLKSTIASLTSRISDLETAQADALHVVRAQNNNNN